MRSVRLLVKHLSLRSGASLPNDREQWLNLMFCERAFRRACRRSLLASSKSTSQTARRLCVACKHLRSTQLVSAGCPPATRLMACQSALSCVMMTRQLFPKNTAAGVCSCVFLTAAFAGYASTAHAHALAPDLTMRDNAWRAALRHPAILCDRSGYVADPALLHMAPSRACTACCSVVQPGLCCSAKAEPSV